MAQLLVRNLDEPLKKRLQRRAKRNGRSMEAEVREILRDALKKDEEAPKRGLGSEIVALFSGQGIGLDEPIREWRGYPVEPTNDHPRLECHLRSYVGPSVHGRSRVAGPPAAAIRLDHFDHGL